MPRRQQLNDFFANHEKQAFRLACYSLQDADAALDAVQDVMLKFVEKYAHKPTTQWPPLFFRMLQHRIVDDHRRNQRQAGLFGWFAGIAAKGHVSNDNGRNSPLENLPGAIQNQPENAAQLNETGQQIEKALAALPERQRQAFLLRCWQGMSVRETARCMGCSQGSVKTHLSRALAALRQQLGHLNT
jgi:RNA polymerase sigma-70 factor (ECF subfamily)